MKKKNNIILLIIVILSIILLIMLAILFKVKLMNIKTQDSDIIRDNKISSSIEKVAGAFAVNAYAATTTDAPTFKIYDKNSSDSKTVEFVNMFPGDSQTLDFTVDVFHTDKVILNYAFEISNAYEVVPKDKNHPIGSKIYDSSTYNRVSDPEGTLAEALKISILSEGGQDNNTIVGQVEELASYFGSFATDTNTEERESFQTLCVNRDGNNVDRINYQITVSLDTGVGDPGYLTDEKDNPRYDADGTRYMDKGLVLKMIWWVSDYKNPPPQVDTKTDYEYDPRPPHKEYKKHHPRKYYLKEEEQGELVNPPSTGFYVEEIVKDNTIKIIGIATISLWFIILLIVKRRKKNANQRGAI